jgi:hypothetical protein
MAYGDRGIGIALLSDSDNFESVAREIVRAAMGNRASPSDWLRHVPFVRAEVKRPPPAPVAIDVDPVILRTYVGDYELAAGTVLRVKVEDGKLYFSFDGPQWDEVYAGTKTRFFIPGDDARAVFAGGAAGRVTGLNLESGVSG